MEGIWSKVGNADAGGSETHRKWQRGWALKIYYGRAAKLYQITFIPDAPTPSQPAHETPSILFKTFISCMWSLATSLAP
jgi:hypothetical protein